MHLGHALSAVYASRRGDLLLRIEDIDSTRCRPEFEESIYEDLAWLGLDYGRPVVRQSERFAAYESALGVLSSADLLYPCFCTRSAIKREVESAASAPHGPDGPLYPGTCRRLSVPERAERTASGENYSLRLDMSAAVALAGDLSWHDEHLGRQAAHPEKFGDVVLARKETPASYHLCVTVDDAWQGVELVTRGTDLLEATHVHRLLQALLGLPSPAYSHHVLVTGDDGKKLSKRDGAETLKALREAGVSVGTVLAKIDAILAA